MRTLYDLPNDIKDIIYDKKYKAEYNDVIEELKSKNHLYYDDCMFNRLWDYMVFREVGAEFYDDEWDDNAEWEKVDVCSIFDSVEQLIDTYNLPMDEKTIDRRWYS